MNDNEWMQLLAQHDSWNERHLLSAFSVLGIPTSMLDLGCGTGVMVKSSRLLKVDAYGVDQLPHPEMYLIRHDLNNPFVLGEQVARPNVQMVISLEVAEHINPENHDTFCDTISRHVQPHGTLVFAAAHPGQDGEGHVGVKPAYYWRDKLHARDFNYNESLTMKLSLAWRNMGSPLMWLSCNVQVFEK